jgi:tetratricopeptide (TPR) repeat protein
LVAYSAKNGAELWRITAGGWFAGELCLEGGSVYALSWSGDLYALDARSGRILWKARGERDKGFTSPPVVVGDKLFIGSRVYREASGQHLPAYALLALNVDDGAELWRFETRKHVFIPASIVGDTLLVSADDGRFYARDSSSGAEYWVAQIDERVVAQPQIDGDVVYVGTRTGTVYALRWRASPAEPILAPNAYLERGQPEQAAIAYALHGQLETAAAIYARRLDRPREAALLYERAGQPGRAAPLWRALGDLRRARDCYEAAGHASGLAETMAALGEPLQAAHIYEQSGNLEAAASLYEQHGERSRAAELYDQLGYYSRARVIWESLGDWERQVEDLIREGQSAAAAAILDRRGQTERAAELYEQAGQLQSALELRLRLKHWERIVVLAEQLGDDEQAAQAHEQLGHFQLAAEAYERAAEHAAAAAPIDDERVAALYEHAAVLYESIYRERRAAACRDMVMRRRRLPRVVVTGEAHDAFVEYEWNALTLRMENIGYGPARDISLELIGEFDVSDDLRVAYLLPERPVAREISVRPHREHYGPKVPLKIVVSYQDQHGKVNHAEQRQPVHVLRQGAERGGITPTEIRVGSDGPPSGRTAMAGPEEIDGQQTLLATHRQTLAHYLQQLAVLGSAHAPPGVTYGIREARDNIHRIKAVLRGWGVQVEDQPNDEEQPAHAPVTSDRSDAARDATMPDKRALREALVEKFALEDLDVLCADLEQDLAADGIALRVNLELVGGSGKAGKALNLISYLDHRGYLGYLVQAARRARPGLV